VGRSNHGRDLQDESDDQSDRAREYPVQNRGNNHGTDNPNQSRGGGG